VTAELPSPPQQTRPLSPLRVWLPPEIGTGTEGGSQELANQIRAYQSNHPELEIVIEQKPVDGQGGLINYLQTGQDVAPSILPDVVAVPAAILADEQYHELFSPLNPFIDPAQMSSVYPAPAALVMAGESILGYPFATSGISHLVFNTSVVTGTISVQWTEFISGTNHTMVFPADSREGAVLGLQFYLAEGGEVVDESGRSMLEIEPLARALGHIGLRKENLLQSAQLKTLDEAWQYHQLGFSDFVWVRSAFFLEQQAGETSLVETHGYTPTPGVTGSLVPLTTTWAWAIATDDPARQELAADLIMFLTTPQNLANWSRLTHMLPARRDAMTMLAEDNPYYLFAHQESERARPMPVSETSRLLDVIGDAVFQVLTTDTPPLLLAEQASSALRQ
jgi:ABC-type glycerol-3-phosphate transport system substrate-binding protein